MQRRPVWRTDEEESVRTRLVSAAKRTVAFLGRHDKWVTLFASILVFSTFIIKDIWRENSKDLVDKIQSGLTKYRSEKNQRTLVDRLKELEVKTGAIPEYDKDSLIEFLKTLQVLPPGTCANLLQTPTEIMFGLLTKRLSTFSADSGPMDLHTRFWPLKRFDVITE